MLKVVCERFRFTKKFRKFWLGCKYYFFRAFLWKILGNKWNFENLVPFIKKNKLRTWCFTSVTVRKFKQVISYFPFSLRYPVILLRFHLNPGTGGDGFHKGGDGVIRELGFRKTQVLSVLTERRSAFRPYGVQGKSQQGTELVTSRTEGPCSFMFQLRCISDRG